VGVYKLGLLVYAVTKLRVWVESACVLPTVGKYTVLELVAYGICKPFSGVPLTLLPFPAAQDTGRQSP
jgi:hypothetical protein